MKIGSKLWPLECTHGFTKNWPSDLVFDLMWPIGFDMIYWTYISYHTKYEPNPSYDFETRASAQWVTNTPGQRHFLMYKKTQINEI